MFSPYHIPPISFVLDVAGRSGMDLLSQAGGRH